jgi:crotonobetainyl-CoA:carnitine CoA-transferase CaiB-like acyl-CoA transferase
MTTEPNKPLAGIRILDLTHMLSGPYGSMILADLGAETIKVEPLQGEGTRRLLAKDPKNSLDGMGAYYITLNRNKKSIALNLKDADGLETFYDLVREADVVISNFGAGVPERLRIDYATLAQINPRIITCTVTGFGSDGPNPNRPAFDQVAQATGGGMSITGTDPGHPVRSGIPIGDLGGGMFAVMGILAALVERGGSGRGQHVDISMLDCQISMLNYMATMYFLSGEDPFPIGNSHFVHVPYNTFHTADGFIVIAVITDNFWHNLKEVVDCEEFADPKYDTQPGRWEDREMINRRLDEVLRQNSSAYWLSRLQEKRTVTSRCDIATWSSS